ncbi:MAG: TadE/TadG family type IV pilus assembly protein [Cyanobacteriota bacterium]
MKNNYRRFKGQNLVELVVVLPLLVVLILGIMQLGLYWRTFQTIESVALEGSNVAASTVDNYGTPVNEPVTASIDAINNRLAMAGLPTVTSGNVTVQDGTAPYALYQSPAANNPGDMQITIDYRNPTANGVVVQVVYGYRPILAGTRIPVPGGTDITIIPDFIKVSSSQIQQYNTY